jgi:HSP20 family protein
MATNLTLWDPFRDMVSLNDAVNRLMREAFVRPNFGSFSDMPLNVVEQSQQYLLQVALPGVRPEDIDVTCEGDRVTIRAQRAAPFTTNVSQNNSSQEKEQPRYLLQEWGEGEFVRTVTLPKPVEADKVTASFDQGILTLTLPIVAHAQSKKIPISAGPAIKQLAGVTTH